MPFLPRIFEGPGSMGATPLVPSSGPDRAPPAHVPDPPPNEAGSPDAPLSALPISDALDPDAAPVEAPPPPQLEAPP